MGFAGSRQWRGCGQRTNKHIRALQKNHMLRETTSLPLPQSCPLSGPTQCALTCSSSVSLPIAVMQAQALAARGRLQTQSPSLSAFCAPCRSPMIDLPHDLFPAILRFVRNAAIGVVHNFHSAATQLSPHLRSLPSREASGQTRRAQHDSRRLSSCAAPARSCHS